MIFEIDIIFADVEKAKAEAEAKQNKAKAKAEAKAERKIFSTHNPFCDYTQHKEQS